MQAITLGDYRLIRTIARGGMGEVYQAYDTKCLRYVALKKIRQDLEHYQGIRKRFLAEAHIAASLSHPSIIPIFSIHAHSDPLYYTMPLLEGQTLRSLIVQARQDPELLSIQQAVRIFLTVSQGIAHAHVRGFLHRDIKAENIWLGSSHEPLILDWGVAKSVLDPHHETLQDLWGFLETSFLALNETQANTETPATSRTPSTMHTPLHLTRPGKVVGTLSYMAPERALRGQISYASDIFSLGVLFYLMLTFQMPFQRKSLKEYLRHAALEKYIDPRTRAPLREIPKELTRVIDRCLAFDPNNRYLTVQDLIDDLRRFMEARSDWVHHAELLPQRDKDWLGKELVYLNTPIYTQPASQSYSMGWVTRMLSRSRFEGNLKVRIEIKPKEESHGVGLLLATSSQENTPLEGYCLWIGAEGSQGGQLLRSGVMVLDLPNFCLRIGCTHHLVVELVGNVLHCYFDHLPKVTYVSYLPIGGSHVGLIVGKGLFDFLRLHVFAGKDNLQVSCLAVPDAFLAQKMYRQALREYRRIGQSFFDYLEGREAIFRAGITLIEWARQSPHAHEKDELLSDARLEFEKLKDTLSAPLEWLGKALIYRELGSEEEISALELACHRFAGHVLINWIHEEVVFRLQEKSTINRRQRCRLVLLIVRALLSFVQRRDVVIQITALLPQLPEVQFWNPGYLLQGEDLTQSRAIDFLGLRMSYFLGDLPSLNQWIRPILMASTLKPHHIDFLQDALYTFLYLGAPEEAWTLCRTLNERHQPLFTTWYPFDFHHRGQVTLSSERAPDRQALDFEEQRFLLWLLEEQIEVRIQDPSSGYEIILEWGMRILRLPLTRPQAELLLPLLGWLVMAACLVEKRADRLEGDPRLYQLQLLLQHWWERSADYWPSEVDTTGDFFAPMVFLRACDFMLKEEFAKGVALFQQLQQLPSHHWLALLEGWCHHRLLTLKKWLDQSLTGEKRALLRDGWLWLHLSCANLLAQEHYQTLMSGAAYGANTRK